ncbi:class I SAM-dependent methyltransferase [Halioglobus maricola]|nr:class I SAM-dependent methyltransferase [Halioglobus maricola]
MAKNSLSIRKIMLEESASSPDFQYLLRQVETEALKVFDEVVVATLVPGRVYQPVDTTHILLIDEQNVYVSAASFEKMLACDSEICLPLSFNALSGAALVEGVHTQRHYERAERLLEACAVPDDEERSGIHVALYKAETFNKECRGQMIDNVHAYQSASEACETATAGFYYLFSDYYGNQRLDILDRLPVDAQTVLEVGCGRGLTGKAIKELHNCHVTGIELNPEVAEEARNHLDAVICANVEDLQISQNYDVIIATELFEHLVNPEEFLVKSYDALNSGGCLILTVPNVGHYQVVEDLLAGRWDYVASGLLCYTHLRFFTQSTLEDWCIRSPYTEYSIERQTGDLPERVSRWSQVAETDQESLSTLGFYVRLVK